MRHWLFLLTLPLAFALPAHAADYVVQPGDTLGVIAQREHIGVSALIQANRIINANLIRAGMVLAIPSSVQEARVQVLEYRVRSGDTLLGIANQYGLTVGAIRALNPRLGAYPLAGQWLRLCSRCAASTAAPSVVVTSGQTYTVRPGDTLLGIAVRFGTSVGSLLSANRLINPNLVVIGTRLAVPQGIASMPNAYLTHSLIVAASERFGVAPSLALAVGWQESGFNQNLVSQTGAIGVMQVEPYTGAVINRLLGRSLNLYRLQDNVNAGVFWLSYLLGYYNGNGRLAIAAYYQGARSLARHGYFADTVQYVSNVLALQVHFAG